MTALSWFHTVLCGFVGFLETVLGAIPGGLVSVPDLVELFVQLGDLVAQRGSRVEDLMREAKEGAPNAMDAVPTVAPLHKASDLAAMSTERSWRMRMMTTVGPGLLGGITLGTWRRLLADPALKPDASCLPRAAAITLQSFRNSLLAAIERRRFGPVVRQTVLKPPLFILGHWRSGTTHLHELLTKDPRFGFPNGYQACFPHTFLTAERLDRAWMSAFLPAERPMDNMKWSLSSPQEDEFALGAATLCSPCTGWVFPRQRERFEQYLTFRHAAPQDLARWRAALLGFLRKVQWRCGQPLVLKSPPHTARIRLLLELFPEAKFVHIQRDPYRVFQSSRRTLSILLDWHRLQRRDGIDMDDWVLRQYRAMYDAFFEDRPLIPRANYYEIAFEELEQNPLREVEKLYEALGLPEFSVCEPALRRYLDSLRGYHKNTFTELPKALTERIGSEWARCFDAWGYNR